MLFSKLVWGPVTPTRCPSATESVLGNFFDIYTPQRAALPCVALLCLLRNLPEHLPSCRTLFRTCHGIAVHGVLQKWRHAAMCFRAVNPCV